MNIQPVSVEQSQYGHHYLRSPNDTREMIRVSQATHDTDQETVWPIIYHNRYCKNVI
jgi:hypothetical protein